jgi:hypothetical protein
MPTRAVARPVCDQLVTRHRFGIFAGLTLNCYRINYDTRIILLVKHARRAFDAGCKCQVVQVAGHAKCCRAIETI